MKEIADRGLRIADSRNEQSKTQYVAASDTPVAKPLVADINPQSAIRNPQSIELHIEELILDGFTPDSGERFAIAIENELARLINERGIGQPVTESMEIERLAGGAFRLNPDEQSETAGRHLAKAIYKGMTGGMRG